MGRNRPVQQQQQSHVEYDLRLFRIGVHDDDECTDGSTYFSGTGNTISTNTINEACAGILTGSDATGTYSGNTFLNVTTTIESGDSCTPLVNVKSHGKHRPASGTTHTGRK